MIMPTLEEQSEALMAEIEKLEALWSENRTLGQTLVLQGSEDLRTHIGHRINGGY